MGTGSTIMIIVMVILTLWWVMWPLLRGDLGFNLVDESEQQILTELLLRRDAFYTAIKDLEQDLEAGKLTEVDYQPLRTKLTWQAAQVLREIDALTQSSDQNVEAEIDILLSQFQQDQKNSSTNSDLFEQVDQLGCPNCGHQPQPEDTFCAQCGTRLIMEVTE